ncbi:hypothetical protein GW17_00009451 [Ensete ventricosum]|uniref:Uncharacterized protein n=1 Tax=Ensete ventricosum TaxID=4639 RepID=A0A427AU39_ENSVE|nr:hypothetical protein B296_00015805 [Ensete ventricosum]RWW26186.1 hypothetical protein GW17_00009451 [Ensete ventricosum]RZR78328.1 hypothetical protein BHM03_00003610 [Ensete ventricosum]
MSSSLSADGDGFFLRQEAFMQVQSPADSFSVLSLLPPLLLSSPSSGVAAPPQHPTPSFAIASSATPLFLLLHCSRPPPPSSSFSATLNSTPLPATP